MKRILGLFFTIGAACGSSAFATQINQGVYRLHNHPDGAERPPLYGLRLDELINITSGHDVFTFNFDDPASNMQMVYGGSTLHIFGQAFGGLDSGSAYHPAHSGLWEIDMTYAAVTTVPSDDDLWINTPDASNVGFIRPVGGQPIPLYDFSGDFGYTLRIGDENNDQGHRGYSGISGWGWLNHGSPQVHVASSDWLFTAQPIPEPASIALLALGLLATLRRR